VTRLKSIGPTLEKLRALEEGRESQPPRITLTLNANQAHLVAEALYYGAGELEQYADGHGRAIDGVYTHCDYLYGLERGLLAFAENPREHVGELRLDQPAELPDQAVAKRYERLLRETAMLRYPYKERTPELQERIEATIARKTQEFAEERQAKAYEASLRKAIAERHPNLSPEERKYYDERITKPVAEYRQAQAWQKPRRATPTATGTDAGGPNRAAGEGNGGVTTDRFRARACNLARYTL
jgi:hypothetical protein